MRPTALISTALLALTATLPLSAQAESFASSASSAGSASSGSVSDSFGKSSDSSSRDKKVAEGEYRVLTAEQAPGRQDTLRLKLQPVAAGQGEPFFLYLPNKAVADKPLKAGDTVTARQRAYGFEFARVETREPFYLVLHDDWHRELQSHPVTL